jgi:GntR family transcriptional regulator
MTGSSIQISPTSLHERVTTDLLARIQAGQFPPGSMIPTEATLCTDYGVSRITVRRAVAALVERGLVTRRRGIGSVVTGRPAELREFHMIGFLDEKLNFDHRVLSDSVGAAEARVAAALGIEPGSPARHIRSLVHRGTEPFTLADAYTADLPDRRVSAEDYAIGLPTATAMGRRLGRRVVRAEQELDAVAVDAAVAKCLGLVAGAPVIRARRTYFSVDDQPIHHLVVQYHPAHYRFMVDLVPRSGTTAFATPADTATPAAPINQIWEDKA